MTQGLDISLAPEKLDEGSPEERAAFGLLSIRAGSLCLTEGFDWFIDALRPGPLVSGYHAAEWFAWNWWRILYEPYSPRASDWWRAHQMNAIGEGYVWPNITFRTDGVRAAIISAPSANPDAKPFRFVGAYQWLGPLGHLEEAIRTFFLRVIHRLEATGIEGTNLQRIVTDLASERLDVDQMKRRRLEALLGHDPDEVDDSVIQSLLDDAEQLGTAAVDELAADAVGSTAARASTLRTIASAEGIEVRRGDAVRLSSRDLSEARAHPVAWRQGRHAARTLRIKEGLGAGALSTARLSQFLGASTGAPDRNYGMAPLSFLLNESGKSARVVLRSKWDTGRRFELARLLGDHLLFGSGTPILPATRAYTFRQKVQRSFAAELLSPFEAVEDMLNGDFSQEAIEEVAEHFTVSTITVEMLLRNHDLIERDTLADAA